MYLIYFESEWSCEYACGKNTSIYKAYSTIDKAIETLKEPDEELNAKKKA